MLTSKDELWSVAGGPVYTGEQPRSTFGYFRVSKTCSLSFCPKEAACILTQLGVKEDVRLLISCVFLFHLCKLGTLGESG